MLQVLVENMMSQRPHDKSWRGTLKIYQAQQNTYTSNQLYITKFTQFK